VNYQTDQAVLQGIGPDILLPEIIRRGHMDQTRTIGIIMAHEGDRQALALLQEAALLATTVGQVGLRQATTEATVAGRLQLATMGSTLLRVQDLAGQPTTGRLALSVGLRLAVRQAESEGRAAKLQVTTPIAPTAIAGAQALLPLFLLRRRGSRVAHHHRDTHIHV
jgi:hypothetical protein